MKKFIAIASAVIMFAGAAQAQDSTKHHQHNHGAKAQQWSKEVGLTDAQKKDFKALNESFREQAKAIRDNKSLTEEQKKDQLQALKKQQHEKMQSILTPEQKEKIKSTAKEHKGKKGKFAAKDDSKKQKKDGKAFDPAKMKEKLNLTDAQAAKIKENQAQFKAKADAIRSNDKLTQEQKKEQFKALAEQRKESLKSILTAEQQEKMKSARKHGRDAK